MSVRFYELLAVRAKQTAIFNEKESACSKMQHEKLAGTVLWSQRSTEPRLQMLEAGQYLKKCNSSAPHPRMWFGAGKTAGPNLKKKIMLRHRSFVTLHIVFHTSKFGEQTVTCTLRHCALTSSTDLQTLYLQILCKIFCTLQAQRRREFFKLHVTSFTRMLSEPLTLPENRRYRIP